MDLKDQMCYKIYFFIKNFFKFILRERESVLAGEGQRERERENPKQALSALSVQSPTWGWDP